MINVYLKNRAQKDVKGLPKHVQKRVLEKITQLTQNPRPEEAKKLKWKDYYRLRVGDYRVVYYIENDALFIARVASRQEVYKMLL